MTERGARLQPAGWTPPPQVYTELQQRLVQRDGLGAARTPFRNQLHALMQQPIVIASVGTRLETWIATLNAEVATVEQASAAMLQPDEAWAAAAARLATITGVGTLTMAWILTTTINFTLTVTPEAAAHYAGLAPPLSQSGSSVRGRPRVGHGGNARLRRALYLAPWSAVQHNPVIKAFYTRLCAAGKPRTVAGCAAARKLLRIAWAVANNDQDVDPADAARKCVEQAAV